jgi:hypothetical protein
LQISSDLGLVNGDKIWNDNALYFVPIAGWTAGIRYNLSLMGIARSIDGREIRVEHFVSFYAINKNEPPLLELHIPSNSASVGTNGIVLEFYFSRSMDRLSVESALALEGIGNKTFEWLGDDRILKITPDKALLPWVFYKWNLKDSAKSIDGIPLPKSYNGHFITDLDQVLPSVTNVFPVLNADGSWFPTGANIETGLGQGQGIAVVFNKPMSENVLRSLRFEPSLAGRTEYLSENSIVYILTRDPELETTYTLIVSGETRDNEGLKIGTDFRISFTPDIPFLNILSFSADSNIVIENFSLTNSIPINISTGTGDFFFSIRFSLPFGINEKQNAPRKISLVPFFPGTIAPIALQYVSWFSDDRLYMRWEGLTAGEGEISHYYKLTIPGGKNGISSSMGIYMKEDITLYLEVIK